MKVEESKIIEAYNRGESMNAIAKKFHIYATSVKRILERNHIELRHDVKREGTFYVRDGEKLIEWAKSQGRLVTKTELANVIGRKRLSPSYFIKYPELGQYVQTEAQTELEEYYQKLYTWLQDSNIDYKPNDRTKLKVSVDALLLGDYNNIALQIVKKPKSMSTKRYYDSIQMKVDRAKEAGVTLLLLNEDHFKNLKAVKILLDGLKN